jgi:hypothetical protein
MHVPFNQLNISFLALAKKIAQNNSNINFSVYLPAIMVNGKNWF